jgi:tellurite resistance protein
MSTAPTPLKFLGPAWFTAVLGLSGLALAWRAAVPVLGELAGAIALVISALAALVFGLLALASVLRWQRHPEAWAEDVRHPVRHPFMAALPIALLLVATTATAAGWTGPVVLVTWAVGSLVQLSLTLWVLKRWWRGNQAGGLQWVGMTPALFIPIVGNVLVPLAGVPLGQPEWAAAQGAIGALFWPVVLALLAVRIAHQGLWPERLLPATFIVIAPPAVIGLAALQLGTPSLVGWAFWGIAAFSFLWVLPLAQRIVQLPFGLPHWGLSFPMAAFTALTLRLMPATGVGGLLGVSLLAVTSLLLAALTLTTLRGLRNGGLLVPETLPLQTASNPVNGP